MNNSGNPAKTMSPDILIVGGDMDPSIIRMIIRCGDLGVKSHTCLMGESGTSTIAFDLQTGEFTANGNILKPKSVFIRADVFKYLQDQNMNTWHAANDWANLFQGWVIANKDIHILNRNHFNRPHVNKTAVLIHAKSIGMDVPETIMTNSVEHMNRMIEKRKCIQKPIDGGDHTKMIDMLSPDYYPTGRTARPLIIQQALVFPEIRIFRVKDKMIAYHIESKHLDYREVNDAHINEIDVPRNLGDKLMQLSTEMDMDFCAADFKSCPDTGKFLFLEINSSPMFAGFDNRSNGRLTEAMINALLQKS